MLPSLLGHLGLKVWRARLGPRAEEAQIQGDAKRSLRGANERARDNVFVTRGFDRLRELDVMRADSHKRRRPRNLVRHMKNATPVERLDGVVRDRPGSRNVLAAREPCAFDRRRSAEYSCPRSDR